MSLRLASDSMVWDVRIHTANLRSKESIFSIRAFKSSSPVGRVWKNNAAEASKLSFS